MAYIYPFRMASGTATMVLIDPVTEEVIIGVRSDNAWVYPGADSMPGGFMEARFVESSQDEAMMESRRFCDTTLGMRYIADEYSEGENLEECAVREIKEELCTDIDISQLKMFTVRSNSRTDTRAHVINACYYVVLRPEQVASLQAGDDLKEISKWKIADLENVTEGDRPMAFNHFEIMKAGIAAYEFEKRVAWLESEVRRLSGQGDI